MDGERDRTIKPLKCENREIVEVKPASATIAGQLPPK